MADFFLNSSAIVKRYLNETGTAWIRSILNASGGNRGFVARVTGVEVIAAITRRKLGGGLAIEDAAAAVSDFRRDLSNEYWILELSPAVLGRAMDLAEARGLRGYDAVQLAAAKEDFFLRLATNMAPLTFVSADQALNTAANAEGLLVDDPNAHP